jgi:hypothetical protein
MPVFVANGDSDPMILAQFSYLLAGLIPRARVKIYRTRRTAACFSTTPSSPRRRRFLWSEKEPLGAAGTASRASASTARDNAVLIAGCSAAGRAGLLRGDARVRRRRSRR